MTFPQTLRLAMQAAGMDQVTLAEKSGASRAAISQYLSGRNVPKPERVRAMAEALGIPPEDLLTPKQPAALPVRKITTAAAAKCMGKSEQFVRVGLQKGILPFGNAVPGQGQRQSYYISPALFRAYVGAETFDSYFFPAGGV